MLHNCSLCPMLYDHLDNTNTPIFLETIDVDRLWIYLNSFECQVVRRILSMSQSINKKRKSLFLL